MSKLLLENKTETKNLITDEIKSFLQEELKNIVDEELNKFLEENLEEKNFLKKAATGALAFGIGAGASSMLSPKEKEKQEISQYKEPIKEPEVINQQREPQLNTKFPILNRIGSKLEQINPNIFNDSTPQGRAAKAIAAMLAGVEVYGTIQNDQEMFSLMGGGKKVNNRMKGFAQFDTKYHADKINTPQKYVDFFGKTITGRERFPNGKQRFDAVSDLAKKIEKGIIKSGDDLIKWAKQSRFGGSNWEGVDKGWGRVPGLSQTLVDYVRGEEKDKGNI